MQCSAVLYYSCCTVLCCAVFCIALLGTSQDSTEHQCETFSSKSTEDHDTTRYNAIRRNATSSESTSIQSKQINPIHLVSVTRFPSFRTQTLENLSRYIWKNRFLSNPDPGENLVSGNLVMETWCILRSKLGQHSTPPGEVIVIVIVTVNSNGNSK